MVSLRPRDQSGTKVQEEQRDSESQSQSQISDDSSFIEQVKAPRQSLKAKGQKGQAKKLAGRVTNVLQQDLIAAIEDRSNHQNLCRAWMQAYQDSQYKALAKLFTLVLQASGYEGDVSSVDIESSEIDSVVTKIVQSVIKSKHLNEDILMQHQTGKHFKQVSYVAWWDVLIKQTVASDHIFDGTLFDQLCDLLTNLSKCSIRQFRFGATFTAAQILTHLVTSYAETQQQQDTSQRQLSAEEKRLKADDARIERLSADVQNCNIKLQSLQDLLSSLFRAVFSERYRDVCNVIRALVIQCIGKWALILPEKYLDNSYLKFIAWALYDRDPVVRRTTVQGLTGLFNEPAHVNAMQDFVSRFSSRCIDLMDDVDEGVIVLSVGMVGAMLKNEVLQHDQVAAVFRLLTGESPRVQQAAANLVQHLLPQLGQLQISIMNAKELSEHVDDYDDFEQLCGILYVMDSLNSTKKVDELTSESDDVDKPLDDQVATYIVELLYTRVPSLTNWDVYLSVLLSPGSMTLPSIPTTHILTLLTLAAKKSSGAPLTLGPLAPPPKALTLRQKQTAKKNQKELTTILLQQLPELFVRYQADPIKLAPLARMPIALDLQVCRSMDQGEDLLLEIVSKLQQCFNTGTSPEVLQSAAATLQYFATQSAKSLADKVRLVVDDIVSKTTRSVITAANAVKRMDSATLAAQRDSIDTHGFKNVAVDKHLFSLYMSLCRVCILSGGCMGDERVQELQEPWAIVEAAGSGGDDYLGFDITRFSAQILFQQLLFRQEAVISKKVATSGGGGRGKKGRNKRNNGDQTDEDSQDGEETTNIEEEDVRQTLKQDISRFIGHLTDILNWQLDMPQFAPNVDNQANIAQLSYTMLSDCLAAFAGSLLSTTPMNGFQQTPTATQVETIWDYCDAVLQIPLDFPESDNIDELDEYQQTQLQSKLTILTNVLKFKQLAVIDAARVIAFSAAGDSYLWLASRIVANILLHGQEVEDAIQDLFAVIRERYSHTVPDVVFGAMQIAFEAYVEGGQREEDLQDITDLSHQLASYFTPTAASRPLLTKVLQKGITFAVENPPHNLACLTVCLPAFIKKLTAADGSGLIKYIKEGAAGASLEPGAPGWGPIANFIDLVQDRVEKGGVRKGGLKKGGKKEGGRGGITFVEGVTGGEATKTAVEETEEPSGVFIDSVQELPQQALCSPLPAKANTEETSGVISQKGLSVSEGSQLESNIQQSGSQRQSGRFSGVSQDAQNGNSEQQLVESQLNPLVPTFSDHSQPHSAQHAQHTQQTRSIYETQGTLTPQSGRSGQKRGREYQETSVSYQTGQTGTGMHVSGTTADANMFNMLATQGRESEVEEASELDNLPPARLRKRR